ncbi:MAG TPA: hypothetical protein VK615_07660 [Candidatus Binatia bacterium]|nr:hypothetical protein [Candidatus Binatia bacterium]
MSCNLGRAAVLVFLWTHATLAQEWNYINRWEKPTSGYWEEPYWTLRAAVTGLRSRHFRQPWLEGAGDRSEHRAGLFTKPEVGQPDCEVA